MIPALLERRVAQLEQEVRNLRQWVQSGPGATTVAGATSFRPYQIGFPAKLTSTYDATTGYDWEMRYLPSTGPVADATNPFTGAQAWDAGGRTDLTSGQAVWMEPDPAGRGFIFTVSASASSGLTAEEADGSPSYTSITTLRFDQADGFVLTNPSAGVARVDIAAATTTQTGVVSTTIQAFAGQKQFTDALIVGNTGEQVSLYPDSEWSLTAPTNEASQPTPETLTPPDGSGEGGALFRSDDAVTFGAILCGPSPGANRGADFWFLPNPGSTYSGRFISTGRYSYYQPSDGKVHTGATATISPGALAKGGIVTDAGSAGVSSTYTLSVGGTDYDFTFTNGWLTAVALTGS